MKKHWAKYPKYQRGGSPPGYNAWIAAVTAAGATPTATDTAAVSALLTSMAANNFLLADFDYIYLMIGSNPADTATNRYNQKRINLANPGTFDATVNSPNASGHTASGTLGNASMYWDTGLSSSTRLVNRTNNASWGCIATTDSTVAVGSVGGWEFVGGNVGYFILKQGANCVVQYGTPGSSATAATPTTPCMFYMNAPSNSFNVYRNTTSISSSSSVSATLSTRSDYVFGSNNAPAGYQTDATLALRWHGRSFTAGERTAWYTIWQTFMAAYSVTI